MNLFNFPIKRPITVLMGMGMVLLLGLIALNKMPLDLMPKINFPNLMIIIQYPGAGPEEVEERVGKVVERAVKTAADIKNVKVTAQPEICIVNAEFNWGKDLDAAAADVREKIDMVRKYLPDDIEEPLVIKIDPSQMPVIFLHLEDPTGRLNLADLFDLTNDQVVPMLERLPGVASAFAMGGLTREIQVNLDREKLKQYNLSFSSVIMALATQNLDQTAGHVEEGPFRFRVKGKSQFQSVEEIENLVVGWGMNQAQAQKQALMPMLEKLIPYKDPLAAKGALSPIRLRDVGEVVDSYKERNGFVRVVLKGKEPVEGIGIAVMKETDANMVQVAQAVKKALPGIIANLPKGVSLRPTFDLSEIIIDTINALSRSAVEGAILAALVIFVFLWHIRPSIIVVTSIPLSILAAFVCMYFADFTLNIMTLGGLVIAVGKLVDDSIVVMENIYRHLGMGKHPFQAAEEGFREVAVAVLSATLVAIIIFLPVAFTEGLSAQLFRSFAATVFFALMGSLAVSYTVVPMLSSRILKQETEEPGKKKRRGRVFAAIQEVYGRLLGWSLDNWGKVLAMAAVVMVLTAIMAAAVPMEFMPKMVAGYYQAHFKLPPGTRIEETKVVVERIQKKLVKGIPDFKRLFMIVGETGDPMRAAFRGGEMGPNEGEMILTMKKKSEGRTTSDEELRRLWDEIKAETPAAEINFQEISDIMMQSRKPIQIKVFGDDFGTLRKITDRIAEAVKPVKGLKDITTTMEKGVPEYVFRFDRDKLAAYGLSAGGIFGPMMPGSVIPDVTTAVGGQLAGLYREAGKEYDITVRLKEEDRDSFQDIGDIPIASQSGLVVPLRDIARFQFGEGPVKIERENSKRVAMVEANKTDRALSDIINDIQAILKTIPLPEGYTVEFGGEYEDMIDAFIDLAIMFVAAVVLVYMILASLYESLIHPITIMVAVPLAFTGAIAGLFLTGLAFGVTAFIGMIMLVGIVATNSIVLMDFIIEYHRKGMPRREAIVEAGKTRLRPILMTALTTLFGVLPIALGRAEGMELQQPLGVVMVGGLFSSTALTLIVVPVFYQLFDDFAEDMKNLFRRKKKQETKS